MSQNDSPSVDSGPNLRSYVEVVSALLLFSGFLYFVCDRYAGISLSADELLQPLFAQLFLVGLVWTVMVVFRNYAILGKIISGKYYEAYNQDIPPDWIERPARTFNNLMQVPQLFTVAVILTMITEYQDLAQLILMWIFVATRYAHAMVYMIWNHVASRFALYAAGVLTLFVIFFRFAAMAFSF